MNIVLFGSSFNPPHLGHIFVIEQAFELIKNIDKLWLLPCWRHTFNKNMAPPDQRMEMAVLLQQSLNVKVRQKTSICAIEYDYKLSGQTYDTLQVLKKKYPQHKFSFLMGSDQLKTFKKWGNWQKLLKQMRFYVYPRNGYENKINFPNMTLLKADTQVITNLSSTLVRNRIKKGLSIKNIVPEKIMKYI